MHSHRNMPYPLFPTKRTGTAQSFSSVRPRCLRSCYTMCGVPVGKSSAWSIAEAGLLVCHANTWFTVTGCALKALLPVPALQGWESFPSLAVPACPSCCLRSEHPECFGTKSVLRKSLASRAVAFNPALAPCLTAGLPGPPQA